MTHRKRDGRLVGLLLIAQLATGLIVPYVVLRPITTAPAGFLEAAAAMEPLLRFNVLLLILGGAIPVGISAMVWPIVRGRCPWLGLWMVTLAGVNGALQLVENGHWLTMLSVSRAFAAAGSADTESFRPLAVAVRSGWVWAHYAHILAVVGWFFALYAALFRAGITPRILAAAGIATCLLHTAGITLPMFAGYRMSGPTFFGMPLGVATLAVAARLLVTGFDDPHPSSDGISRGVGPEATHA